MECQICYEKLNKSTRKSIECPSPDCNKTTCLACFKRYLLEGGDIKPKCMTCTKKMSYMFVREQVPITWVNKDYLELRTKHLLAREKSFLPESQQDAKEEIDRRERQSKIEEIQKIIIDYQKKIALLQRQQHILSRRPIKETKVVTRRRCPQEVCEGFLEENWKCGLCKIKCCSGCGDEKEEDHECDEITKATFEKIKAETRPCPKCAAPIHKWEGCNQMFCTQCSCMFDYRTGRLETGFFHNPHFFEAMENGTIQRRGGNGEPRCGDIRDYDFIHKLRTWKRVTNNIDTETFSKITNVLRLTNHITAITLQNGRYSEDDGTECRIMRRDFLLKELDEKEWLKRLKVIEKARERNTEIRQILELFRDIGRDILLNIQEIVNEVKLQHGWSSKLPAKNIIVNNVTIHEPHQYVVEQIKELDNFTDFCNDKFVKIEFYFKNKAPRISKDWETGNCLRI